MRAKAYSILLILLWILFSPARLEAAEANRSEGRSLQAPFLDFGRFWVFSAGIHKFKDNYLHPGKEAVVGEDQDLMRVLSSRGVPDDHICFLRDEEASESNCRSGLNALITRAKPGDTLLFFMHSHGGDGVICTYEKGQAWRYEELIQQIENNFPGNRALIFIAACHSGSFIDVLKQQPRRVSYFVMTTVHAEKSAWTIGTADFEACVADAFKGSPCPDLNRDGVISCEELARYVQRDQRELFESLPQFSFTGDFDGNTIISNAAERQGRWQCCLVRTEGGFTGRIVRQDGDRLLLRTRKSPGTVVWTKIHRVKLLEEK